MSDSDKLPIREIGEAIIENKNNIVFMDKNHRVMELDSITNCVNDGVLLVYVKEVKR